MRDERFERLYSEHAQALFGFLAYRTGDPTVAEDLLAETFERALKARSRFDRRKASEKTWLYAIAMNSLRDRARRRAPEERALTRAATIAREPGRAELDRVEDRDELARALAALTEEERETLALRFGADMTIPEIARLVGKPHTTVDGRLYRGLRKLRDELA